jgi:hypothetical protein
MKFNRVECLLRYAFNLLNYQNKLFIKELGRPRPDLPNLQTVAGRSEYCVLLFGGVIFVSGSQKVRYVINTE